jgi:hypothetical protein
MSDTSHTTPRCTKAARIRRVDVVYRYLLDGLDTSDIIERVGKEHAAWGVKERAIKQYIHDARQLISEAGAFERAEEFARAVAELRHLFRKALEKGDINAARLARKDLTELYGLNAPKRIEITEILALVDSEIAEREQELADLERQYALPPADRPGD